MGDLDDAVLATNNGAPQTAIALALIDIAASLRTLNDKLDQFDNYGLPVRKKTM